MKLLIIEPMFSPLTLQDLDAILPCLLLALGQPPSSLILDKAGSNLGLSLKAWAAKMELPAELVKISPFINDLEESLVGHIRAVDDADAVIAFWKNDNTVVAHAVTTACARKGIPLICFYSW